MAKIKFIGELSRVIVGKRMYNGDTRDVNDKLVDGLRSDPDVVILEDVKAAQVVDAPELPETAEEPATTETLWNPDAVLIEKPARVGKARKAHVEKSAFPEKKKRSRK